MMANPRSAGESRCFSRTAPFSPSQRRSGLALASLLAGSSSRSGSPVTRIVGVPHAPAFPRTRVASIHDADHDGPPESEYRAACDPFEVACIAEDREPVGPPPDPGSVGPSKDLGKTCAHQCDLNHPNRWAASPTRRSPSDGVHTMSLPKRPPGRRRHDPRAGQLGAG